MSAAAAGILHFLPKGDVFCAAEEDGPAEELGSLSSMSAPELGEDEFVEIQVRPLLPCQQESRRSGLAWRQQLLTQVSHERQRG